MPDPARYRRIADYHIERLIHKYNPADQEIVQKYIDMVRPKKGPVRPGFAALHDLKKERESKRL